MNFARILSVESRLLKQIRLLAKTEKRLHIHNIASAANAVNIRWAHTVYKPLQWSPSQQLTAQFHSQGNPKRNRDRMSTVRPDVIVTDPNAVPNPRPKKLPTITEPVEALLPPSRARASRKNRIAADELSALGFLNVRGFTTADEYNLEELHGALKNQDLYETKRYFSTENLDGEQNVLFVSAKYLVDMQPREIFFFREGSVVFWNCDAVEISNVLNFLRSFERESYLNTLVQGESEAMPYTYIPTAAVDVEGDLVAESSDLCTSRAFFQNGRFFVTNDEDNFLYKYTFSNAIAQSIKLGMWEATLDRYIDSMEYLTEDLKRGRRLRISRAAMLRKTGELFALRHVINLSSDLLDAPDFYWDREELEGLYLQVCSYFSISRRTKVMNEKINHCVELAELVSHNLNDAHHIRLEWMIIILIMVEVGFEILHFINRLTERKTSHQSHQSQHNLNAA